MTKKNNVLNYVVIGAGTAILLGSGVLTVVPYVGFLASVAALNISLPFVAICAVFSVVTIALSYKSIRESKVLAEKENKISEMEKQLAKKEKVIKDKTELIVEFNEEGKQRRQERKEKQAGACEMDLRSLFKEEKQAEDSDMDFSNLFSENAKNGNRTSSIENQIVEKKKSYAGKVVFRALPVVASILFIKEGLQVASNVVSNPIDSTVGQSLPLDIPYQVAGNVIDNPINRVALPFNSFLENRVDEYNDTLICALGSYNHNFSIPEKSSRGVLSNMLSRFMSYSNDTCALENPEHDFSVSSKKADNSSMFSKAKNFVPNAISDITGCEGHYVDEEYPNATLSKPRTMNNLVSLEQVNYCPLNIYASSL
ncbi:hypothetical protein [Wolbachia endosymbiont of Ctenocephalides felis wCfeT]|uniref:hypothetical protein n=1 Tax=Wolbachia endosymbiont of Ctenocephalides felis wCfeT TaxID=2732593 RepID=UPI001446F5CC|nr:hypothetical protein [Wolbachia endosymbiont of Ctenocephalides felis wCfeT]